MDIRKGDILVLGRPEDKNDEREYLVLHEKCGIVEIVELDVGKPEIRMLNENLVYMKGYYLLIKQVKPRQGIALLHHFAPLPVSA